jgi:hypothetical protein
MSSSDQSIVLSCNPWKIPDPRTALSGILEGCPTPAQQRKMINAAKAARKKWKPNAAALALVQQLEAFVGHKVTVQLWDQSMWWHELEGPFAFYALCINVEVRLVEEFQQAFLQLSDISEISNDIGYSPTPYFQEVEGCDDVYVSLANLYEITKVKVGGMSE